MSTSAEAVHVAVCNFRGFMRFASSPWLHDVLAAQNKQNTVQYLDHRWPAALRSHGSHGSHLLARMLSACSFSWRPGPWLRSDGPDSGLGHWAGRRQGSRQPTAESIPASRWVVVEIIAGLWEGIWGSLPIRAGDDGFVSGER